MASILPFHSTHPSAKVYHDSSLCKEGNNIESIYIKTGTADRKKCKYCTKA
ncbi:hypothetical protein [uncultured Lacinutrix sp.]|uniref:hypothetical protein n=1 Tax=uncultured Lacinutrix sp. TaxID=574032 RepID=UPI00261315E1|nr:hypothetical protein [uncultured Lacinutrix sp.]